MKLKGLLILSTVASLLTYGRTSIAKPWWKRQSVSLYRNLEALGFSCSHTAKGTICTIKSVSGKNFNYSQPVVLLFASNLIRPKRTLIHLHGHRFGIPRDLSIGAMLEDFDFQNQLIEAGAQDSIFVFPVSKGKCINFEQELAPQFSSFMDWLKRVSAPLSPEVILSGHSGSYRAIGTALDSISKQSPRKAQNLKAVALLDASYANDEAYFEPWKAIFMQNPNLEIFSVYRSEGGTKLGSEHLQKLFDLDSRHVYEALTNDHYQVVNQHYHQILKKLIHSKVAQ